jgi:hypothetical protein
VQGTREPAGGGQEEPGGARGSQREPGGGCVGAYGAVLDGAGACHVDGHTGTYRQSYLCFTYAFMGGWINIKVVLFIRFTVNLRLLV